MPGTCFSEEASASAAPQISLTHKEIVYTFKGLPASLHMKITGESEPARMSVYKTSNDSPQKRHPLLLLIQGSQGSKGTDTDFGRSVAGDDDFIIVNLPSYKESVPALAGDGCNHWDRMRIGPGDGAFIWSNYKPMLVQLFKDFPNIDREKTVFGGFSNGGNTAAALLSDPESAADFLSFFQHFVFAEGGWGLKPAAAMNQCSAIVLQGELRKTKRLDQEVCSLRNAGAKVFEYAMEGVEHEYSTAGKNRTRQWLKELIAAPAKAAEPTPLPDAASHPSN